MGNACRLPRHCLHLFVPAERTTVGGHGESDLDTQWMVCGMDGMHLEDARVHGPTIIINVVLKERCYNRKPVKGQKLGYRLVEKT